MTRVVESPRPWGTDAFPFGLYDCRWDVTELLHDSPSVLGHALTLLIESTMFAWPLCRQATLPGHSWGSESAMESVLRRA